MIKEALFNSWRLLVDGHHSYEPPHGACTEPPPEFEFALAQQTDPDSTIQQLHNSPTPQPGPIGHGPSTNPKSLSYPQNQPHA